MPKADSIKSKDHVLDEKMRVMVSTYALMDKAYDADRLIEQLVERVIIPVIPPRVNRKVQRKYDKHIYKEHHLVECFIGKIKQFRRVFSRFEKWTKNYRHFICFSSYLDEMKIQSNVNRT